MVAEREEIEFQRLTLHHLDVGDIVDDNLGKVGLTRLGAQRSELGTVESHEIILAWVLVDESLQHAWIIVIVILGMLITEERNALQFFGITAHCYFCEIKILNNKY